MANFLDTIVSEVESIFTSTNYEVSKSVNTLRDLNNETNKWNVLIDMLSDTKQENESEYYLNGNRSGLLQLIIYIGFNVNQDSTGDGLARAKSNEILTDVFKKFSDFNWNKQSNDTIFNLQIHNGIILDYYPINNDKDGKCLLGITANIEYSINRM
jgi:hypothetical protein